MKIYINKTILTLYDILYVPNIMCDLLSTMKIMSTGYVIKGDHNGWKITKE